MRRYRFLLFVFLGAISLSSEAFSLFPKAARVSDSRRLYVWTVNTCPSEPKQNLAPLLIPIVMALGADAISALVSSATAPISAGASADKSGYQVTTTMPQFYLRVRKTKDEDGKLTFSVIAPRCYVIAYTSPASSPVDWCKDPEFGASMHDSCMNGKSELQNFSTAQNMQVAVPPDNEPEGPVLGPYQPLAVPEFYVEISLVNSGYASDSMQIVTPTPIAMFFPQSLLGSTFEKGRKKHLALTLDFSSPVPGADSFKNAGVALDIGGITPGQIDTVFLKNNSTAGWAVLPSFKPPTEKDVSPSDTHTEFPYLPVTIKASLHEVGDENAFLQALSAGFTSSTAVSGLSSALDNALMPGNSTALTNSANFQSAQSKYYAAIATYKTACGTYAKSQSAIDKATAQADYYAVGAAWSALSAAGAVAGQSPGQEQGNQTCF